MTVPRFSISTLMAVVLVAALNLSASDIVYGPADMAWPDLINFGARPMASILAIGLLSLLLNPSPQSGGRQYLIGFEVFGVAALFFYIVSARFFALQIHEGAGDFLKPYISTATPLFPWSLTAMFLLPQLSIALIGGWLNTRYRLTLRIERRQIGAAEPA
jgi:hypothetical protein